MVILWGGIGNWMFEFSPPSASLPPPHRKLMGRNRVTTIALTVKYNSSPMTCIGEVAAQRADGGAIDASV
jgi:hypothetical protein